MLYVNVRREFVHTFWELKQFLLHWPTCIALLFDHIAGQGCEDTAIYRWLSARLQYIKCVINGDTAVLHQAFDIMVTDSLIHRQ